MACLNHYRAYASDRRGNTTGSASINGNADDARRMAERLHRACNGDRVEVWRSGNARRPVAVIAAG